MTSLVFITISTLAFIIFSIDPEFRPDFASKLQCSRSNSHQDVDQYLVRLHSVNLHAASFHLSLNEMAISEPWAYSHADGFHISATSSQAQNLSQLPFVKGVRRRPPEDKLDPSLRASNSTDASKDGAASATLLAFLTPAARDDAPHVAAQLASSLRRALDGGGAAIAPRALSAPSSRSCR